MTTVHPKASVDLGGTWLRIRTGSELTKLAAPSVLNRPGAQPAELIDDLLDTLCTAIPEGAVVTMSCGAAMDEQYGIVHGSGPLWGGELTEPLQLAGLLRQRRPDAAWQVINDVTAGLASFVERFSRPDDRRVAYFTISSGIAVRIADLTERSVPVDAHGMQGEVGHLPAVSSAAEIVRELPCPCGGSGHVAAVSAGPALPRLAEALGVAGAPVLRSELSARVLAGDTLAQRVLTLVVEPIAELIRSLRCFDPRIDLFGLGGGYVEGLGSVYRDELARQLGIARSYADAGYGAQWFGDHVRVCRPGDIDSLDGAAAMAQGTLTVTKH
ncbi:ROK family protein [Nocardia sp. CNY236]|uniref:ROK family protein n=1 Tax=Nocardia sp. CNY236 TaxID=1169152 RepID=UPI000403326C|nr:ROK family protein [Nocardia sp. CNY236]